MKGPRDATLPAAPVLQRARAVLGAAVRRDLRGLADLAVPHQLPPDRPALNRVPAAAVAAVVVVPIITYPVDMLLLQRSALLVDRRAQRRCLRTSA